MASGESSMERMEEVRSQSIIILLTQIENYIYLVEGKKA